MYVYIKMTSLTQEENYYEIEKLFDRAYPFSRLVFKHDLHLIELNVPCYCLLACWLGRPYGSIQKNSYATMLARWVKGLRSRSDG